MTKNRLSVTLLFAAALACSPMAVLGQSRDDNSAIQDMHNAGRDTKDAAKDAGHGVKKGTEKGYNATKNGTEKGYNKTKRGTKRAWHKTENTTKGAVHGAKEGAHSSDDNDTSR